MAAACIDQARWSILSLFYFQIQSVRQAQSLVFGRAQTLTNTQATTEVDSRWWLTPSLQSQFLYSRQIFYLCKVIHEIACDPLVNAPKLFFPGTINP
jgi:hypothetical protein